MRSKYLQSPLEAHKKDDDEVKKRSTPETTNALIGRVVRLKDVLYRPHVSL